MTSETPQSTRTGDGFSPADPSGTVTGKSAAWWFGHCLNALLLLASGILLIFLLGLAQRGGWIRTGTGATAGTQQSVEEIYTCPMHPQIRQNGPGRCPICGMEIVPAATAGGGGDELSLNIEPSQRRLANIQTAEVTERPVSTTIRTIGSIEIDESRQAIIAAYIDGRVERMFADYTGVVVSKDDHLAVLYSPELYSAQVEYLQAKQTLAASANSGLQSVRNAQTKLVQNSRGRLQELGMSDQQLTQLDASGDPQSRSTIYSPLNGTVIEKLAEEGKYISAGEPLYRIADLSTVWLMLQLYPEDASRIRFGQRVEAELTSLPGRILEGRVGFIEPRVDPRNRTVGIRVEFDNERGELRPGDYAQATITVPIGPKGEIYDAELAGKWISPMHPQIIADQPGDCPICGMALVPTSRHGYADQPVDQQSALTIPRSALLMAGEHSVVYVETEPGRFEIRNVKIGALLTSEAVILEGLDAGEMVATAGNFLIDSQMQLAGKPSLIDPARAVPRFRNTPLKFSDIRITRLPDQSGQQLEEMYRAYFEIQRSLSADKLPDEASVSSVQRLSAELGRHDELTEDVREQLQQIADNIPDLHAQEIEAARVRFKSVSHAVVTLATMIRGADATQPFNHFFCPMVKQGEGDWLQTEDQLSNPYWGSMMLRCGDLVRTIAPSATAADADAAADARQLSPDAPADVSAPSPKPETQPDESSPEAVQPEGDQ